MNSSDSSPGDSSPPGSAGATPPQGSPPYDPVYLHSLRELGVILALFLTFFAWAITTSYYAGYPGSASESPAPPLVLGMPAWAFWGVFFPWLLVDVAALWFCFFFMKNDDLGTAHEEQDLSEQIAREAEREVGNE